MPWAENSIACLSAGCVTKLVFLLDEIDKLGHDFRGDPSSALLEVLDPEQNSSFSDHYLDVAFDLSKVLFIATANETDTIPAALKDRMEVIELPGYTFEEKINIAKQHLIPKQILAHGITNDHIEIPDESILLLAHGYTREAGVRNLEREVAAVCRYVAVLVAKSTQENADKAFKKIVIDKERIEKVLGPERYYNETSERTSIPGIATGLAWTAAGGDLLFIEATRMGGKGSLILTGKLGDVMKESAQTALSWVRSRAADLSLATSINEHFLDKTDIHIHFPAGAIPKDGPSAGVTIITALVSLLTGRRAKPNLAMTGEVTLRGLVLPVGGIKEKILAAHRAGVKQVIMPVRNQKDLEDIPKNVRSEIKFVFVKNVDEVLEAALVPDKTKKKELKISPQEEAAQA
jgi:ATP-dependent Lon protease